MGKETVVKETLDQVYYWLIENIMLYTKIRHIHSG